MEKIAALIAAQMILDKREKHRDEALAKATSRGDRLASLLAKLRSAARSDTKRAAADARAAVDADASGGKPSNGKSTPSTKSPNHPHHHRPKATKKPAPIQAPEPPREPAFKAELDEAAPTPLKWRFAATDDDDIPPRPRGLVGRGAQREVGAKLSNLATLERTRDLSPDKVDFKAPPPRPPTVVAVNKKPTSAKNAPAAPAAKPPRAPVVRGSKSPTRHSAIYGKPRKKPTTKTAWH